MSQHKMTVENQSGPAARADINGALGALASSSIGDNPPPVTFPGQWWVDTGTTISTDGPWVRQRNSGNSAWLRRFKADMDFVGALISQTHTAVTTSGNAPAFSVTTALGNTVPLAAGQRFRVKFHAAGMAGSNTLTRDGLNSGGIKQYDASGSKVSPVIAAGMLSDIEFDGEDYVLLNPLLGKGVGMVSYFANTTPPAGWLKCNGAAVSRTTYATLFAAIGTTYGAGDGATTFNLPDLRGTFLRALDDGRGLDVGRGIGSGQNAYAGNITASIQDRGFGSGAAYNAMWGMTIQGHAWAVSGVGSNAAATVDVTPGDARPINVALLACIKYS